MTTTERLDTVVALVAGLGISGLTVKALSTNQIQADGELLLVPPAAAVAIAASDLTPLSADGKRARDDVQGEIFLVGEDFAGGDAPAKAAFVLLDAVTALHGSKLGAGNEQLRLTGWRTEAAAAGKVVLSVAFRIDYGVLQGS